MNLPDRILDKIAFEPMTGCWLWTAVKGPTGYGHVGFKRGGIYRTGTKAHRVIYEIFKGPVPDGLELDHLCRMRCCVNPDHLEPVTHQVNMHRGLLGSKPACPQGHLYDEANTRILVDKTGLPRRDCRTCKNANSRRRYREKHPVVQRKRRHKEVWEDVPKLWSDG